MSLLTAPQKPTTFLTPSTSNPRPILNLLSPALKSSLKIYTLLSITTLYLILRTYILSLILLRQSFYASQLLFFQSYYVSSILAKQGYWVGKEGIRRLYKSSEKLRSKLLFEFTVFILGSGNGVILLVFWPGWIVIGGGAWGVWMICG